MSEGLFKLDSCHHTEEFFRNNFLWILSCLTGKLGYCWSSQTFGSFRALYKTPCTPPSWLPLKIPSIPQKIHLSTERPTEKWRFFYNIISTVSLTFHTLTGMTTCLSLLNLTFTHWSFIKLTEVFSLVNAVMKSHTFIPCSVMLMSVNVLYMAAEWIMCVCMHACEHMPVCVIMSSSADPTNGSWTVDRSPSGSLASGCLPGLKRSAQWNCAGLIGPKSNHSDVCCNTNHSDWLDCNAWPVLQKSSFSRLLPYYNYFNRANALIGWGKVAAASSLIGCLDTSVLPLVGCLEESGRRAHPILPLWQSV